MTKAKPRLADVQCTRLQFQPGDRILVRAFQSVSKKDIVKIHKMVDKWSGGICEVLVIDATKMELEIEKANIITNV